MFRKLLSVFLCMVFLLTLVPVLGQGAEAAEKESYEYAILGMEYISISQSKASWTTVGSSHRGMMSLDLTGKDSNIDTLYAPFTCVVRMVSEKNGNTVWVESCDAEGNPKKVHYADGELDYMTLQLTHSNDISKLKKGTVIRQGEALYTEGTTGNASGNHIHFECGRGRFQSGGWEPTGYQYYSGGKYHSSQRIKNYMNPEDALFLLDDSQTENGVFPFRKSDTSKSYGLNGFTFQWHTSAICDHDCNQKGICKLCGEYIRKNDAAVMKSLKLFSNPEVYRLTCAAQVRPGPYEECNVPGKVKTPKGTELIIVGSLTNAVDHLWYLTDTGKYIPAQYVEYVRKDTRVSLDALTASGVTDSNAILKTTVRKQKGMTAQEFGAVLVGPINHPLSFKMQRFSTEDPNGSTTASRTSYSLSVDLKKEAKFNLVSGGLYLVMLTVKVDGTSFSSAPQFVRLSSGGGIQNNPVLDASSMKLLEDSLGSDLPEFLPSSSSEAPVKTDSVVRLTPTTNASYAAKEKVGATNAVLVTQIYKSAGTRITRSGMELYDAAGNLIKDYWHNVNNVGLNTTVFHSWYDVNGEMGVGLQPNTTYQYRFHVTVDGVNYYGETYAFTTTGTAAAAVTLTPTTNSSYAAKEWYGETNACVVTQIRKQAGTNISRSGIEVYDAQGTLLADYWHNVNNVGKNTTVFHSWYDMNAEVGLTLIPGTTYRYRFHVTVDGANYYGDTYAFTTAGTAPDPLNGAAFTVSLNPNREDATLSRTAVKAIHGSTYGSLPAPAWTGGSFLGWYTAPDGGTKIEAGTAVTLESDQTLYAHWKAASHIVTFDPTGGTVSPGSRVVTNDETFGALPVPVREGYEFLGWAASRGGGTYLTDNSVVSAAGDFTVYAVWQTHRILLTIGSPFLTVDDTVTTIDAGGTVPVIRNNRTLVPIRCIIEAMGGTVDWNASNRMVTLSLGGKCLYLIIDSRQVLDETGVTHTLDTAPILVNDRTMLPVRFVAEYFGAEVGWNGSTSTVSIFY